MSEHLDSCLSIVVYNDRYPQNIIHEAFLSKTLNYFNRGRLVRMEMSYHDIKLQFIGISSPYKRG